jgi:serine/threonine-protein kinase
MTFRLSDFVPLNDYETIEDFTNKISDKSENNFIYLRFVLLGIEKGKYKDSTLEQFPQGLESYYEFHWRRMAMNDEKIKIVYILGEVRQPVSRQQICEFSGENSRVVQSVLREWDQFLHTFKKNGLKQYTPYHPSFKDFLHRKDILEETGITIPGINQLIVNSLIEGLFDDENI